MRLFGGKSFVGGVANFLVDFGFEGFDLFLVEDAFADEEQRELRNRIAVRFVFALFGSFVKFFVVGKRMGIGARYVRVNESGSATLAAILNGGLADGVAFERVGAVAFGDVQARETAREFGDAAAGGLHLDGNGNGVAVVFNQVKQRKLFGAGGVQRFPEFAFAGGTIACGDINNFVGFVANMLAERRFLGLCQGLRMIPVIKRGFGGAYCLHKLRAGAGGLVDDIQVGDGPSAKASGGRRSWDRLWRRRLAGACRAALRRASGKERGHGSRNKANRCRDEEEAP